VGVIETAREFAEQRADHAKPKDLLKYCARQASSNDCSQGLEAANRGCGCGRRI
jgi:hypothetical protein